MGRKKSTHVQNPALEAWSLAYSFLSEHPLFSPLFHRAWFHDDSEEHHLCQRNGYAVVNSRGMISYNYRHNLLKNGFLLWLTVSCIWDLAILIAKGQLSHGIWPVIAW
jgi:hypothetical protein